MGELTPLYAEFKKKVEAQRKVVARKQKLVDAQKDILKEILTGCIHEELEEKDYYYSGDYYNKAYTEKWYQCKLCGECGPKTVEMHSYYG